VSALRRSGAVTVRTQFDSGTGLVYRPRRFVEADSMAGRLTSVTGLGVLALGLAAALGGCRGKAPAPSADVYTVRGVVEKLPQADGPDKNMYIHHQPIPSFRDEHGKVVGMMSMTMPFPVAAGVSLAGIAPGDPVEFTFTMSWGQPSGYQITRIQKLPPGTVINFEP
jgi:Cu/Ag efflux protein CusF